MLLREPKHIRGRDSGLPECPGFIFRAHADHLISVFGIPAWHHDRRHAQGMGEGNSISLSFTFGYRAEAGRFVRLTG